MSGAGEQTRKFYAGGIPAILAGNSSIAGERIRIAVDKDLEKLYAHVAAEAKSQIGEPLPRWTEYLWDWFVEIRNFHDDARQPLKPSELDAWARMRALDLDAFEATTMLHMDVVWRGNLPKPKKR